LAQDDDDDDDVKAPVDEDDDSDDGEAEVKESHALETIDVATLQGKWKHSAGFFLTVRKEKVKTKTGQRYKLLSTGDSMELHGDSTIWRAVPAKSSGDTIHWVSAEDSNYSLQWSFEGTLKNKGEGKPKASSTGGGGGGGGGNPEHSEDDDMIEDDPEIDRSLIVATKRRRGRVDYVQLDKTLGKGADAPARDGVQITDDKVSGWCEAPSLVLLGRNLVVIKMLWRRHALLSFEPL